MGGPEMAPHTPPRSSNSLTPSERRLTGPSFYNHWRYAKPR